MRTLYLDCGMGAAGDMLTAALLELLPDPDKMIGELNALGIPDVRFERETVSKCGINGTHMRVTVNGKEEESEDAGVHEHEHSHAHEKGHEHHHEHDHTHEQDHDHGNDYREYHTHAHSDGHDEDHAHTHEHGHSHEHHGLHDIEHIVRDHLKLPKKVQDDVLSVFGLIAEAESHVHGAPITEIHFHEVGTLDAVADVAAVCLIMDKLAPKKVIVSPIHVGSGQVHCAHGILPVPAPATAYILKDVPIYGGEIKGELCTPTGAALLKYFATGYGAMPPMKVESIGYGMGKKDFEAANCVRAMIGEGGQSKAEDEVLELSCNIDDMTAEAIGFAMERLLEGGALDVYTLPINMKKSRPGTLLRLMCQEEQRDAMIKLLFKHTTTIGIRENRYRRYILDREIDELETPYGIVREKRSEGYGISRSKFEYEDLARIAKEKDISLSEAAKLVKRSKAD